jgi:hypothetical protein
VGTRSPIRKPLIHNMNFAVCPCTANSGLEQAEYDKLIRERLAQADQGGPFIKHEDVEQYFEAKSRGEEPVAPPTFHL